VEKSSAKVENYFLSTTESYYTEKAFEAQHQGGLPASCSSAARRFANLLVQQQGD